MGSEIRRRRSMLYIPGNNPAMIQHGGVYGADGLLLDLEDSVALTRKDAARILIRNMLKKNDFYGKEVSVRVNHLSTPFGMFDLQEIVPQQPNALRLPKIESKEEVLNSIKEIEKIEKQHGLPHDKMKIHPMIETALGVQNVFEIAGASSRIDAITIGGQDLTADMNIEKTKDNTGIDFARKWIVMAAKANNIDALDTVFADIDDEDGLRHEVEYAKTIGFTGKAIINPRQIDIVHEVYDPKEDDVRKAIKIVKEYNKHKDEGIGVFAIDGKMIDAPVVTRAEYVLKLANIKIEELD